MNIALARRVQESILDTNKPFTMNHWDHCIAGHCIMVLRGDGVQDFQDGTGFGHCSYASNKLGITYDEGRELFTCGPPGAYFDLSRTTAVARLEQVIRRYQAKAGTEVAGPAEPSLRGKAPSRSPRATPQEEIPVMAAPVLEPWHGMPHTLRIGIEYQRINRILRDAAREEAEKELALV